MLNPQLLECARTALEWTKKAYGEDPTAFAGSVLPQAPSASSTDVIRQVVREEIANSKGGAGGVKSKKVDTDKIYEEVVRVRKLLTYLYNVMGIGLPPDILDEPAVPPQDPNAQGAAAQAPPTPPAPPTMAPPLPNTGDIPPIEPLGPAAPKTAAARLWELCHEN